ncbi:MAG: RNA polymerase sigma factor RpoD/SigA [Fimbriimonadales bacterium]|nr:RNA polymerase sigma factor RpoD/SigA [Fimbriimonadales bacterium]
MQSFVDYAGSAEVEYWGSEAPEVEPEQSQELSGTALDAILGEVLRRPLLQPDEELELLRRAQQGDEQAQNRLIESNLRLVISIARRYVRPGLPLEDLVQEGALGLVKAIRNFDLARGLRFSTYAVHWIRQSVGRAADAQTNMIRLPNHAIDSLRKIERTRNELRAALGKEPTDEEIAARLEMPVSKVARLARYARANYSLEHKARDEQSTPLGGLLASPEESDPESIAIERVWISEIFEIIEKHLTAGERWAIYRHLGLDVSEIPPGHTKRLSRERTRQLERQALTKLRALAREYFAEK